MSQFATLRKQFAVNWTTILVGWRGLGEFSPWPEHAGDFQPLLSVAELIAYANERCISSDATEHELVMCLLALDLHAERREVITKHLALLSDLCGGDPSDEVRKWRVVLLDDLLDSLPSDPVYGLVALTEFWQAFGFPPDSPHVIQGRGNTFGPDEYYQTSNYRKLVSRHETWIEQERKELLDREPR